ncbi:hypothetical protein OF83DRAFT_1178647 [Amylostereum chailletii]|nr:hypothetical protein OF83DRAFT_1178647 [Amylostereum chailletii]
MSVVNVDPYLPTDTNNRQNTVVSTPVSPLIVAWNNRTVAVVRYDAYDDQIEAVRRARGFQALGGRPFHLEASLPGYGAEAHEISEDLWPHVVRTLRTVTLALDENTPNALDPSAIAGQPDSPHVSDSRTSRSSGGRIFMRSVSGKTTDIEIDSFETTTVNDLKVLYQARENLPIWHQVFIFNTLRLENDRTLHDYDIRNESTIWVTVRLSPGKPVIYLFPPHLIVDASVVLGLTPSWSFSAVYPKARDVSPDNGLHAIEWTVDARADGVLVDKASGSELSYLFWEAQCHLPCTSPLATDLPTFDAHGG